MADAFYDDVDTRPESSPYTGASVRIHFMKDATSATLPQPFLSKFPKLPLPSLWSDAAQLDISQDIGHVLVHHLFTGTYQCLRPNKSSSYESLVTEFTTSIQVYNFAREYEIPSLEALAKGEIERLGNGLSFPMILNLLQSVYPEPGADDVWLSSYLKAGLKSFLHNPPMLSDFGNTECKVVSVSDLLVKNLIELVHDHARFPSFQVAPLHALVRLGSGFKLSEELRPEAEETPVEPEPGSIFEEAPVEPEPESAPQEPEPEHAPEEPPAEPEPEPAPEEPPADAAPEPALELPDDVWTSLRSIKGKKSSKKAQPAEPQPEPGLEPEPDLEFVPERKSKKDKKKKKNQLVEPDPELNPGDKEDDFWGFTAFRKSKPAEPE
ncbi:hypothetical protein GQ53DRAFT_839658 [Thozetella sp. PMI_491]|nr:hypothetical protein GQ53DRAFT_839658 [Thozetella sp. PMI_491]